MKGATYNETHFDDPKFTALIDQAKRELDQAKRNQLLHDAQEIEYNTGGFIIWGFKRPGRRLLEHGAGPPAAPSYLPCSTSGSRRISVSTDMR